MRWYVVNTRFNREKLAEQHLARQGFEVFYPLCARQRSYRGRVKTVSAPLFPRYLFVCFNLNNVRWHVINNTIGVTRLVCQGMQPVPVPEGVVEYFIAHCDDKTGLVPLDSLMTLFPGTKMRVLSGPMRGQEGLVDSLGDKERVILLMKMMDKEIHVTLPLSSVGKL